ncbi:MAG: hypothetical protein KIT84_21075 [Labilithrix sp.]|nr:hypothetical protein [Labilithrix sp.]MCW5813536.1 hypothetical protein [Labilithrix sp.]
MVTGSESGAETIASATSIEIATLSIAVASSPVRSTGGSSRVAIAPRRSSRRRGAAYAVTAMSASSIIRTSGSAVVDSASQRRSALSSGQSDGAAIARSVPRPIAMPLAPTSCARRS